MKTSHNLHREPSVTAELTMNYLYIHLTKLRPIEKCLNLQHFSFVTKFKGLE